MRLTPALYVRHLLAKLQPPFPKSARESQQLLNVLETSFRKHLDDIHPSPIQRTNEESSQRAIPLHSAESSSNATQHYLNTLFTHPLLDIKTGNNQSHVSYTKRAVERYQDAFAHGMVTIDLLKLCVREYCIGLRNAESVDEHDKLGPRLAAWVYSANPVMKELFFLTPSLLDRALHVMIADHEETAVWTWLKMVYERDFGYITGATPKLTDPAWLALEDTLVSNLMRYSIRRKDLDDVALQFAQACQYRVTSERAEVMADSTSSGLSIIPMSSSWNRLAASIILTRMQHGISTTRYDTALKYALPWSKHPIFNVAVLSIYHPAAPSAHLLATKLKNDTSRGSFTRAIKGSNKKMTTAILTTILDGAHLSLKHNLISDANCLLEFASVNFPELVPAAVTARESSLEARLQSIMTTLRELQTATSHLGAA